MISERGKELTVWMIVFTLLTLTTLILRLWAARVQKRTFRMDDLFILIAFVMFHKAELRRTTINSITDLSSQLGRHSILGYPFPQGSRLLSCLISSTGISNGLGAHTETLNEDEQTVQKKVCNVTPRTAFLD
jgi:hypothetical protein